jgi:hypothetical protein
VVLAANLTDEQTTEQLTVLENRIRASFRETAAYTEMSRANPNSRFSVSKMITEIHNNMTLVESLKITIDDEIQDDIVSSLAQPRINALLVLEVS